jgi:hypothetical protein
MGVPVSAKRCSASSWQAVRASFVLGFLIACASSRMTTRYLWRSSSSRSRSMSA